MLSFSLTSVGAMEIDTDVALVTENIIIPRLSFGFRWADDVYDIVFYNALGSSYYSAVNNAMAKWNAVVDPEDPNGNSIHHLSAVTLADPGFVLNTIKFTRPDQTNINEEFLGYMDEELTSNGVYIEFVTIYLNELDYEWTNGSVAGKYDVQSVVTHEIGHALGIKHCHELSAYPNGGPCWSDTCLQNVMQPEISSGMTRRNLRYYDTASYIVIYD